MWKLTFEWFDAVDWSWKHGHVYTDGETREEAKIKASILIRKQSNVSASPYSKTKENPWGVDSLSLEESERIELPFLVET